MSRPYAQANRPLFHQLHFPLVSRPRGPANRPRHRLLTNQQWIRAVRHPSLRLFPRHMDRPPAPPKVQHSPCAQPLSYGQVPRPASQHCHRQRQRSSLRKVPRFFLQKLPVTRRRGGQQNDQQNNRRSSRRIHLRPNRPYYQLQISPRQWIRLLHPHTSPRTNLPLATIVTRLIP